MSGRILLKNIFLETVINAPTFSAELPELLLGESKEDFWQQLEIKTIKVEDVPGEKKNNTLFSTFSGMTPTNFSLSSFSSSSFSPISSFSSFSSNFDERIDKGIDENNDKGIDERTDEKDERTEIKKKEEPVLKKNIEFVESNEQFACWYCGLFFDEKSWGIPIFTSKDTQILKSPYVSSFYVGRSIIQIPTAELKTNYLHETNEIKCHYKPHNDLLDGIHREEIETIKYYGNFCTIFCTIRYLQETEEFTKKCKENYKNILYFIFSKQRNKKIYHIPPALPKTMMKIYSGNMGLTEAEYKIANKALEKQII